MKIVADYHTHTRHSHGRGGVEDNVRAARQKGLRAVAISDHGPAGLGIGIKSAATLLQIKAEVEAAQAKYPDIKALTGVEANVVTLDGDLDVPPDILRRLDVAMAGLHWQIIAPTWKDQTGLVFNNWLGKVSRRAAAKARVDNTKAIVSAVRRYRLDAVTHPGLKLSIDTAELAKACAQRGTALEINASHGNMTRDFVAVGRKAGAKFVVGSDAHRPDRVGDFARALELVRGTGLTADEIINAAPEEE